MSRRFAALDLTAYPIADVIEALDYESYLARAIADFSSRWQAERDQRGDLPNIDIFGLETDPLKIDLEVGAYQELLLRAEVNDRVRSLTLAGAVGRALDHIGATYYRTERRLVSAATDQEPAVYEDDETYRRRLALAPEAWSTAGPEGAYLFWALSSSGGVYDVAAWSEDEGACLSAEVRIAVLPRPEIAPEEVPALLATVQSALRRSDIRPLSDKVTVEAATTLEYAIDVTIYVRSPAAASVIRDEAETSIRRYAEGRLRWVGDDIAGPVWLVGRTIRQDTIAAAALVAGVEEVVVTAPASDINTPAPGYTAALPLSEHATTALSAELTAHLFRAPRPTSITVRVEAAAGGWS